jgi:hypothetical protein
VPFNLNAVSRGAGRHSNLCFQTFVDDVVVSFVAGLSGASNELPSKTGCVSLTLGGIQVEKTKENNILACSGVGTVPIKYETCH